MLIYLFTFLAVAVLGLVQLNWESDEQRRQYARLCPCFTAWRSLDARWALVNAAVRQLAFNLSWGTLSACCAALGGLFGWFIGAPFVRVPLDEVYFFAIFNNNACHGCIQGAAALAPVYIRRADGGEDPPETEKWCPTRARLQCQTVYWTGPAGGRESAATS